MPDTTSTFYAGYAAATLIYASYIVSLWVRGRRARRRVDELRRTRS